MRHEWERRKLELKEKRREMEDKIEKARDAADDAFEDVKKSLDQAWNSFADGVRKVRDSLKG